MLLNRETEKSRSNFSLVSFISSKVGVVEGPFYHNYATTPIQLFLDLAFQVGLYTSAVLAVAAWLSKVQDPKYKILATATKEITYVNFDLRFCHKKSKLQSYL